MTVDYVLALWLEALRPVSPPAWWRALRAAVDELIELIGDLEVAKLDEHDVEALWVRCDIAGYGLRVDVWHWCLNAALTGALTLGLVADNVAERVPPP